MKRLTFTLIAASLVIFIACGSNDQDVKSEMHEDMNAQQHSMDADHNMDADELKSDPTWVRRAPVNVEAIDRDGDGFVYQDHMDWNVIADEAGKCPECGMNLIRTSLADAKANLREQGIEVE